MSPLLASLALLALCWQPSVSRKAESSNYQNLGSYIVQVQPQVGKAIQAKVGGSKASMEQVIALLDLVPNTLLVAMADTGALNKLEFLKKPLGYGYLCEVNDPKLPEKINEIEFNGPPSDEDKQKMAIAMRDEMSIDCAKNPPTSVPQAAASLLRKLHTCFCEEDKGAYCVFAFFFKFALDEKAESSPLPEMIPCPSETLPALLKAGSGALGATWKDLDKFGPETLNNAMNNNVKAFSTTDQAAILCDAVNPAVEKALKAVYASNGAYWFAEIFMFAKAFAQEPTDTEDKTMSQLCSEKALAENPYGKCICKLDTGFTFCLYKVIAKAFINEGILTCDKTDKTKQKFEKKPTGLPNLALPKAPTGGAATSSLTIATLAAAALLLLRQ